MRKPSYTCRSEGDEDLRGDPLRNEVFCEKWVWKEKREVERIWEKREKVKVCNVTNEARRYLCQVFR